MKKLLFAMALTQLCTLQLIAQESSVKILLDEEERFRFDSIQLQFINTGHHVMIGDSAGMDNYANTQTIENTFVGHRAGSRTQSSYNTLIGARAGEKNKNGYENVFLGAWAGRNDTSGRWNTYIGTDAGGYNKTGQKNTFVGKVAGVYSDSSSSCTFVGYAAGAYNKGGSGNVFVGNDAGLNSGKNGYTDGNTYLGSGAGRNNENGLANVFIGFNAGMYDTTSNSLIIANNDTGEPLVYGSFNNKMIRFNAGRLEIRNPQGNTIIGDSSGTQVSGNQNVLVGAQAGKYLQGSYQNVLVGAQAGKSLRGGGDNIFIGYQAGLLNTSSSGNVFIGSLTGWQNTSGRLNAFVGTNAGYANTTGMENTYLGTSAGGGNTTGNFNTCLGRRAGLYTAEGSGNLFIGYYAGANEMGSDKLYIANSGTTEPLIYGDFADKKLKFHADAVQATGEIRADERFNVGGLPGITDTLNTVTSISFAQNKLKYRTTVITGGIITFMSPESEWSDTIEEYLIPCNAIGLMGEFNGGTDDLPMTRTSYNSYLWMLSVKFTIEDDLTEPADSIVEVKFRDNASWTVNWGSTDFPTGTGYQDGPYIPVPLCDYQDTTYYCIQFNCLTGEYSFEELTGLCGDPLIDLRDGKRYATVLIGEQCWMAQNLNVGTRINGGTDQTDNETIEKYCYNDDEANCTRWGGLYQWLELMDYVTMEGTRGICPDGFHVSTDEEFKILEGNVDSQYGPGSPEWDKTGFRGYDAGYNLRSVEGWNGSGNGSDAFGFHAVPGGYYVSYGEPGFQDSGCCNTYFTSSFDEPSNMSYVRHMNKDVGKTISRNTGSTTNGNSLRCLKD